MKYVQAVLALGLFGWLGFAVFTDSLPGGQGGSGKTMALRAAMARATDAFGVTTTAAGLVAIGVALAAILVMRRDPYAD